VTYFQDSRPPYEPERRLTPDQVAYYRRMLATHKNQRDTGACAICGVPSCPDWRHAYDQLAETGELMAHPETPDTDVVDR
jgi:hypothetical protein